MAPSLKKVLLFCLWLLVIGLAADRLLGYGFSYLYRNTLIGETGGKINAYMQLPDRPYLTIFGNSRSVYTLIPDSIPVSSYNLSQNGMDLSYHTSVLSVLSQHQKVGNKVLLLLEPLDFVHDPKKPHNTSDAQHLKHYYGKNPLVTDYVNRISRFEEFKSLSHLYRYNGSVVNMLMFYIKTQRGATERTGYTELPPTPRDSLVTLADAAQLNLRPVGTQTCSTCIGMLKDFVAICRQNKAELVCFSAPNFYDTDAQFALGHQFLDEYLAAEQIPYIDYTRTPLPGIHNPWLWKDATHPNVLGARILVRDLVKRLQKIGFIPERSQANAD